MSNKFRRAKLACYSSYFTMAAVFAVPPMLFETFHKVYGISYTLLGSLVLFNFITQFCIDLIFTFFAKRFNVKKTVTLMPMITCAGFLIYAIVPLLFPEYAFLGLAAGTVVFSISAGLSEVLLSPIIAAIPSDNPEKEMSLLHSIYAWAMVTIILLSSLFFNVFGTENRLFLLIFLASLPLVTAALFWGCELPPMNASDGGKTKFSSKIGIGLALCFLCIFFGAAAENTMTNWISTYMENALGISKSLCDILGIALFSLLLGLARLLNAKYGKNIILVLTLSFAGCILCYLIAGLCTNGLLGAAACIICGFFGSMLWPGTLIMMEENLPSLGVFAYALMAAGGDFGSSIAPQLMGIITDKISESNLAERLSTTLGLSCEQVGLKAGMLISSVFPVLGLLLMLFIMGYFKRKKVQTAV